MNEDKQGATVGDNGAAVNINLGEGFRQFQIIVIALIVALCFSCTLSIVAYQRAADAEAKCAEWSYWAQRVQTTFIANGFKMPKSPAGN